MDDKKLKLQDKEMRFNKGLRELDSSPIDMVNDFRNSSTVDLPVDKIDTKGSIPIKSGGDFMADQIIGDARRSAIKQAGNTLDYTQLKKEFADKARMAARSPAGKKVLGAVPFLGAGYAALSGEPAMAAEELAEDVTGPLGALYGAAKPAATGPESGTFDDRLERGLLSDEEKLQLKMNALKGIR